MQSDDAQANIPKMGFAGIADFSVNSDYLTGMINLQGDDRSASVRVILYDAAGHDRDVALEDVDLASLANDQLLWVDVSGSASVPLPDAMQPALAPGMNAGSLEIFDDFYRFEITLRDPPHPRLRIAVGKSWVLTSSAERPKFFDQFVQSDQGETLKGNMTSTAFTASLLMRHLDGFRQEIARVDVAIDKLDETILRAREKRSPLAMLAGLRRSLSDLRGVLIEQRTIVRGLVAPDFLSQLSSVDREFLVEVNRVFERLEDDIARARETVIGSFDLYASRVAQDTNQLIKVLTIATVVTGVIGAVAGIFGMTFDTPIPSTGIAGFLLVSGSMIIVSAAIVALAIWRRWV